MDAKKGSTPKGPIYEKSQYETAGEEMLAYLKLEKSRENLAVDRKSVV